MNTLGRGMVYSLALHCALAAAIVSARPQLSLSPVRTIDLTLLMSDTTPSSLPPGSDSLNLTDKTGQPEIPPTAALPETAPAPEPEKSVPADTDKIIVTAAVSPAQLSPDLELSGRGTDTPIETAPASPSPAGGNSGQGSGSGTGEATDGVFKAGDLDQPPVPVSRRRPSYPLPARQANIEGRVEIEFLVNAGGRVENVRIIEASPPGVFEESVQRTVSMWSFKPGLIKGQPVRTTVATTIRFELKDTP